MNIQVEVFWVLTST